MDDFAAEQALPEALDVILFSSSRSLFSCFAFSGFSSSLFSFSFIFSFPSSFSLFRSPLLCLSYWLSPCCLCLFLVVYRVVYYYYCLSF